MDFIDDTLKREDHLLQLQIRAAREQRPAAVFTGECLACGEPVEHPRRWCPGVECRDEWERLQGR